MNRLFDGCSAVTDLNPLTNWNTENVTNMMEMFDGCNKLSDVSVINDWDITKVADFNNMFRNCPFHLEFTKRAGTWSSDGTFIPTT